MDNNEIHLSMEKLVYYEKTKDKIDCYLKFQHKKTFYVTNERWLRDKLFISAGTRVIHLQSGGSFLSSVYESIYVEDDGYYVSHIPSGYSPDGLHDGVIGKKGLHLYTIYKNAELFLRHYRVSELEKGFDKLSMSPFIVAKSNGGRVSGFNLYDYLNIRFSYRKGTHIMNLDFNSKRININRNCSMIFLLDNGTVLTFPHFTNPIKYEGGDTNMSVTTILSDRDIEDLSNNTLVKWQINNNENVILLENVYYSEYNERFNEYWRQQLRLFFEEYFSLLMEIKKEYGEEATIKTKDSSEYYIYMEADTSNNSYKIAISKYNKTIDFLDKNNASTRVLLCCKKYPSQRIAEAIESALHNVFYSKHVRNKWYKLDDSDIEEIKELLS